MTFRVFLYHLKAMRSLQKGTLGYFLASWTKLSRMAIISVLIKSPSFSGYIHRWNPRVCTDLFQFFTWDSNPALSSSLGSHSICWCRGSGRISNQIFPFSPSVQFLLSYLCVISSSILKFLGFIFQLELCGFDTLQYLHVEFKCLK